MYNPIVSSEILIVKFRMEYDDDLHLVLVKAFPHAVLRTLCLQR
jgi:hypothetical protein